MRSHAYDADNFHIIPHSDEVRQAFSRRFSRLPRVFIPFLAIFSYSTALVLMGKIKY